MYVEWNWDTVCSHTSKFDTKHVQQIQIYKMEILNGEKL